MRPEPIWKLSVECYRRGWVAPAKLLKTTNYFLFRAVLPYEVELGDRVNLWHRGLGVVIHPNTRIGNDVNIAHGVTIGGNEGGPPMIIGDRVSVGAAATLIPESGRAITVGAGAVVGAASLLRKNVVAGDRVAGNPARPTRESAKSMNVVLDE